MWAAVDRFRIKWTYNDPSGKRPIFEVPTDIIDADMTSNKTGADERFVDDYVTLGAANSLLKVQSYKKTEVYELSSIILVDYLNVIKGTAKTYTGGDPTNFKGIMGLAERVVDDLFLPDGIYSLWARDINSPAEDGKLPGKNLYGTHPFYMAKATDATWFGVYTNLAAAQDWWIKNTNTTGDVEIKTYAAGGLGDMMFIFEDEPTKLITNLHQTILGEPVRVPQWTLGWNQCKWGYKDIDEVKDSVNKYSENNLPLETQWVDIDYLDDYKDFTFDSNGAFKGLKEFADELH